jgi:hypothetical protein
MILLALGIVTMGEKAVLHHRMAGMERFGDLSFVDFENPFHRALLKDVINIYYPGRYEANDSLHRVVVSFHRKAFIDKLHTSHQEERLTLSRCADLLGMYGKFLLIYLLVMACTYYGVQTLAVWRFAYKKRRASDPPHSFIRRIRHALAAFIGAVGTILLFCPAYVIAYSIRTEFNTDTVIFMILLGVISNGSLINYANKFYAFLIAESRKGYVETAIVKNCDAGYSLRGRGGIPFSAMVRPFKRFKGHVFEHIFRNARYQYLSTVKEQASFLITGLIIIEMALNIHGHLSYEMLRQLLYKNYSIVAAIILLIFYTVKCTEMAADIIIHRESLRYENKSQ